MSDGEPIRHPASALILSTTPLGSERPDGPRDDPRLFVANPPGRGILTSHVGTLPVGREDSRGGTRDADARFGDARGGRVAGAVRPLRRGGIRALRPRRPVGGGPAG